MGGGVAFYKQFKKVVNLNNTINCKNQKFIKSQINNILAFSLIELSIVLIIIGLLVAGITGGASLIESAKVKAFYDSLNQYKQALYTFYSTHDRLPGDFNLDGKNGYNSGEIIKKEYFKPPYDGTDTSNRYAIPNEISAPFVELYQEKIINQEFTGKEGVNTTLPNVNGLPRTFCYFSSMTNSNHLDSHYLYGIKSNMIFLQCQTSYNGLGTKGSKFAYQVDRKYDDNLYDSGDFRASCGNGGWGYDYDLAIANKDSCIRYSYIVWEN